MHFFFNIDMGFKFWHYFILSVISALAMVVYACFTREQFYPIILLLVTSKVSFVLMSNLAFATAVVLGQLGVKLFFGQLRDVELELLLERAKYSITETCLALTIFRQELSPVVFVFFFCLLFVKVFHWISRSRLDYLEQVARVSLSTHTMLFLIFILLIAVDAIVCYQCVLYAISKGKTVIVLFAFEFGVLILNGLNNFIRYLIHVVDNSRANGLHYKGLYYMVLDLVCDGLRFVTYVLFFCLVFVYYGLPIHIVRCFFYSFYLYLNRSYVCLCRDVWMAGISFYTRIASLYRYLRLTSNLEERLEDATAEELAEVLPFPSPPHSPSPPPSCSFSPSPSTPPSPSPPPSFKPLPHLLTLSPPYTILLFRPMSV